VSYETAPKRYQKLRKEQKQKNSIRNKGKNDKPTKPCASKTNMSKEEKRLGSNTSGKRKTTENEKNSGNFFPQKVSLFRLTNLNSVNQRRSNSG
jgi:hypothetical protein